MARGDSKIGSQGWPAGSRLPLRQPPGTGVDERIVGRVLAELGLPIDGNPGEYASSYRLFLPQAAERGVRAMLRDARRSPSGAIETGNPEDQIEWLAHVMQVPAPDGRNMWWQKTWNSALKLSGLERGPSALSEGARRVLVRRIASEPPYASQLVRALADALRYDVR